MKLRYKIIAALPIISSLFLNNIFAMDFKDVPQNFWAYQYISDTSNIITGDAAGYFKPNDQIDKFDTAKIFAKAAGYRYLDATQDEKNSYNNAYNKYKSLLDSYAGRYTKWNSMSDREIAYLLDKNIFTQSDLDKFIVKETNTEKLRALSKEEAAEYLTRLIESLYDQLDKSDLSSATRFVDDSLIDNSYKSSINFLSKNGIISGDTDNKFNPKSAVTKTILSVMMSRTLKFISDSNARKVQKVESISGVIEKYFPGIDAVQIMLASGDQKIYKISSNASIKIDGINKNSYELKENMSIVATLNNSIITSIESRSYSSQVDKSEIDKNIKLQSLSGIVDSVSTGEPRTISVKIQLLNPSGGVITQIQKYNLSNNCKISRSNSPINLSEIRNGEIIKVEFYDEIVYSIAVEEKNKRLSGTLLEKKYESGTVYLVIESSEQDDKDNSKDKKEKFEFRLKNDTRITRRNNGDISWSDLKIGDKVTVTAEYNDLTDVYAEGERSTKDGWIEEVKISKDGWVTVKIRDTDNKVQEYSASSGKIDIYSLRINNKVRLEMDSNEIESLTVLDRTSTYYFGEVTGIFDNTTIRVKTDTGNILDIKCNDDTRFKDQNGRDISIGRVFRRDKVAVVMSENSNYAKTVSIVYVGDR